MRKKGLVLMLLSFVWMSSQVMVASKVSAAREASLKKNDQVSKYIVKLIEPPLAAYKGGIKNLRPTSPAPGREQLDMASDAVVEYRTHLGSRQQKVQEAIEGSLGRSLQTLQSYQVVYNGFAAEMSNEEAILVAKLPGIAAVLPDTMQYLHTDNGPVWIGAEDIWNGTSGTAAKGEGIVIGVIDTGINPANRSFADVGDDGYDHNNPKGKFYGFCDPASSQYNPGFACNDKLIGAYDFVYGGTELYDNDGHGSHTASTAGGNVVLSAAVNSPTISFNRNISGVAPHSNIISYKGCGSSGCPESSLLAAIDQAVADGVDVINYSIGGGASDPWTSPTTEAFLNARNAGVFVATSAGNSGPGNETVGSPANAPWLLAVGSSSHDRRLSTTLSNLSRTDGTPLSDIDGKSISDSLPAATSIVYAGASGYDNPLCAPGYWGAGTFSGQIVVCDRGFFGRVEKGQSVLDAGGGGYILINDPANSSSLSSDSNVLPAVHISYNDGVALKNWLASSSSHQGTITATVMDVANANGNIMSSFSSRGANSLLPGFLKPDVSAPGQDILAAYGTNNEEKWDVISGTSMASPHAAGAAALLLSQHPGWSPAIVQSALMTSVDSAVLKEDGITTASPFDTGSGRIDVNRASKTGIVFDVANEEYILANPATGGDPSALNLPSLAANNAVANYSWIRTVKSNAAADVTWAATVSNPAGVLLSVSPPSFTLSSGGTQEVTISADTTGAATGSWLFGAVTFTPDTNQTVAARLPVAIKNTTSNFPDALRKSREYRSSSTVLSDLKTVQDITSLTASLYGMTPATVHEEKIYQDPTNGDPYDGGIGVVEKVINVPPNSKRLVAEIIATTSPDIDLYIWRWTGSTLELVCTSATAASAEYCSIPNPAPGDYYIYVQNWLATDQGGTNPDDVSLATAVVPETDTENFKVAATAGSVIPPGQLFDLEISWQLPGENLHWYGAFGLGSDSGNPDNIGRIDIDLTNIQDNKRKFIVFKGRNGKTTVFTILDNK